MTKLLEEAFAAVSQLPQTEQDAIATLILEKIAERAIATTLIEPAEIESLKELYTFREPPEVLQFLEKYPFLVPLLLDAHGNIRKYFPDSPLFLEYIPDPEIDDPQLVVWIATDLEPEKAIDRLDEFDKDWYRDNPYRDQGKMYFNLD